MTITSEPWQIPGANLSIRLVRIPTVLLDALAAGRDPSPLPEGRLVSSYLVGAEHGSLYRRRRAQLAASPEDEPWVTRFIVVDGIATAVGLAGFHGSPDENGMVEVGYRVAPEHRRHGYARCSLEILLAVASTDQRVRTVRATVSPNNTASRALVDQYGFSVVGEQWDEEDGLEIVLEVSAR